MNHDQHPHLSSYRVYKTTMYKYTEVRLRAHVYMKTLIDELKPVLVCVCHIRSPLSDILYRAEFRVLYGRYTHGVF